jgi:hypothetical protein
MKQKTVGLEDAQGIPAVKKHLLQVKVTQLPMKPKSVTD